MATDKKAVSDLSQYFRMPKLRRKPRFGFNFCTLQARASYSANDVKLVQSETLRAYPLMRLVLLLILSFGLTGLTFALEPQGKLAGPFDVLSVVDGDTVDLESLGTVRLIGIDTPEKFESAKLERDAEATRRKREAIQVMGKAASAFVEALLERQNVWVELGIEERDRYGRVLAYLDLEDPNRAWERGGQSFT